MTVLSPSRRGRNTWEFEDEDNIEDFEDFVQYADIIFLRDATAPSESVAAFPTPYNLLSCGAAHPLIPRVVDSGERLPHANESALAQAGRAHLRTTIEDASALSRHFIGMPAASAKKGPEIISVCIRPPDVHPKALGKHRCRNSEAMAARTTARGHRRPMEAAQAYRFSSRSCGRWSSPGPFNQAISTAT